MGLAVTIPLTLPEPSYAEIAARLAASGEAPKVKMIDGLPAFPDEVPEDGWRELRLGFSAGMVTIRRSASAWECTVWGTADPELLNARDRVAAAFAGN